MKSIKRQATDMLRRRTEKASNKYKKGLSLGDLWPAFTLIAGLFILVIVLLVIFGSDGLGGFFDAGSAEANATTEARDRFIAILPMLGIILLIVVLAAVIGIVVGSLWMGGKNRA